MLRILLYFFFLIVNTFPGPQTEKVTLSEIMFNPRQNENYNEFIEIYNYGDKEVKLKGWQINDGKGSDSIVDAGMGTILMPNNFALILDKDYFDNSSIYDSLISDSALILTIDNSTFGSRGLSNSSPEIISLLNDKGEIVSQYQYTIDNTDGYSDEKIFLEKDNTPDNWGNSIKLHGTPGRKNSISPLQFNLTAVNLEIQPKKPSINDIISVSVIVKNTGIEPVKNFEIIFFIDDNNNCKPENEEIINNPVLCNKIMYYNDSTSVEIEFKPDRTGELILSSVINFEKDENPEDNFISITVQIPFKKRAIIINEIMYYPLPEKPEWIELYNPGSENINLKNWKIRDSNIKKVCLITKENFYLKGKEYMIIVEDSSIFQEYPSVKGLVPHTSFPALNNDGDEIFLIDPSGNIVDYIHYQESWGKERGISLERINPEGESNSVNNWSLSTSKEGATPGTVNSIFRKEFSDKISISVSPNPFSPDNDGFEDYTKITYITPFRNPTVKLEIYDRRGRLIKRLISGENTGSTKTIIWNGKKDNGSKIPVGIYIIYLEAYDPDSGKIVSKKSTVIIARV